jgi:hypothetical protein
MNERIRQLEKQSYTEARHELGGTYMAFDKEKFAELIVKECMKVAMFKDSGTISTAEVAGWMAAGRSTAAKMIKEHFGVEE